MKLYFIAVSITLAGCSNLTQGLENRIACAAAGDKAFTVSQYGPVGISSVIADQDRSVICRKPADVAPAK